MRGFLSIERQSKHIHRERIFRPFIEKKISQKNNQIIKICCAQIEITTHNMSKQKLLVDFFIQFSFSTHPTMLSYKKILIFHRSSVIAK